MTGLFLFLMLTPLMGFSSFIGEMIFRKHTPSIGTYLLLSLGSIFDSSVVYSMGAPWSVILIWSFFATISTLVLLFVIDGTISTKIN